MNFLVLGVESYDPNHPITRKYSQLSEIEALQSDSYFSDIAQLRSHYKEKINLLHTEFNSCLSHYGTFNIPSAGLGAWIKFKKPMNIGGVLPRLAELGIYSQEDNQMLDVSMPIEGIRAGFGTHDVKVYSETFKFLAEYFAA